LRALSHGSVGVTLGFAFTVALALNPIFAPPFPVVLGRTVFVALVCLLGYTLAGHGAQRLGWRWLPPWVAQAAALMLAAPLGTLVVYLLSTGGDLKALTGNPYRVSGFIWISLSALGTGLLLGWGAQARQREAERRTMQLNFELERAHLERQAADARLALLTAQIEPHFLFNTLANVQALVETGSPRAATVLRSLIAYLKAALPRLHRDGVATVADELALVRAYLELMHLRMPDRLGWAVEVAPALLSRPFPPMALLTLVENAVRHGIDPGEDGGRIEVGGAADADGGARLWVRDSGIGLRPGGGTGTGLVNLRDRLQAQFGAAARLSLSEVAPHGVLAEVTLPPPA
ncbi:MAG: sensor histidine kinase, partial [Aquabacterium sp.]